MTGRLDSLPSPERFDAEIRDLIVRALALRARYRFEHRVGLEASGASGVRVKTSAYDRNSTEAAFVGHFQRRTRAACRAAVKMTRGADRALQRAESALAGSEVQQPTRVDPRAIVTQAEFSESVHLARERAVRGD